MTIEAKEAIEKMFYEKNFFDQKALNGFQCFIAVFNQLLVLRCLIILVVFKQAIQAIEAFLRRFWSKQLVFVKKIFFVISL